MKRMNYFYHLCYLYLLAVITIWILYNEDVVFAQIIDKKNSGLESSKIKDDLTNNAPVLNTLSPITVLEGDTITLQPIATDPDRDELTYTYTGWMESAVYTTSHEDSGLHTVTVTVNDGTLSDSQDVAITVVNDNRAPVLAPIADIIVNEGVTIVLNPKASDPDSDKLTFSSSGWMSSDGYVTTHDDVGSYSLFSSPIGVKLPYFYAGMLTSFSYTTSKEDIGTHLVTVTVSDGTLSHSQDVAISVIETKNEVVNITPRTPTLNDIANNTAEAVIYGSGPDSHDGNVSGGSRNRTPVLHPMPDITVNEGDTITLHPTAIDPDEDSLIFIYSGWMRSPVYKTTLDDSGVHQTTITVSDGTLTASQDVTITVVNVNRSSVQESKMDDPGGVVAGGFLPNTNTLSTGRTDLEDDSTTDVNSGPTPAIDTLVVDPTDEATAGTIPGEGIIEVGSPGDGTTEVGPPVQSTLVWDPNSEDTLKGYKVYFGNESGNYYSVVDVGEQIGFSLDTLESGQTYFLVVTAYDSSGNESAFSHEVIYMAPIN